MLLEDTMTRRRHPPSSRPRCEFTGQIRYPTWDEAAMAATNAKIAAALRGHQHRREDHAEYCGQCFGFHVTTRRDRRRPA